MKSQLDRQWVDRNEGTVSTSIVVDGTAASSDSSWWQVEMIHQRQNNKISGNSWSPDRNYRGYCSQVLLRLFVLVISKGLCSLSRRWSTGSEEDSPKTDEVLVGYKGMRYLRSSPAKFSGLFQNILDKVPDDCIVFVAPRQRAALLTVSFVNCSIWMQRPIDPVTSISIGLFTLAQQ